MKFVVVVLQMLSCLLPLAVSAQTKPFYEELWDDTVGRTRETLDEGDWHFLLSARTYHMPFAYSKEQLDDQNNNPLPGFGFARGRYLENGNWSGIYALGFRDSWSKPSYLLGYNYNWVTQTEYARFGWGASMGLMTRNDYFNYFPFPYVLPTFSVGKGRVTLEASYVPALKRGTGNVAFFWLRF
ncbi:MAG: hypothetical protein BSR46_04430 [Candidatus Dactylopiibacterium carminicum]|nr:phospholipid:lipid A palmitoyltransferase [Candidatus Dactylopiibacterium carminicum]PAT00140.1 MAG: hypothetical protein BSR46_04430 [Candidatus Dactylopiibacterium carminicum]